jgi:outer membrane cobalamin receptor
MNGVINIITTPPREMLGTTFVLGVGTFDHSGGAAESDNGLLYSIAATHAQALNDRWAFKITGGAYTQNAFARPQGTLPNDFHTPYPNYPNKGTTQPKADLRIDYDFPDGKRHLVLGGGYVSTTGIGHTGAGPLDCRLCVGSYGKVDYIQNLLRITAFVNAENTDSPSLLFKDAAGRPVEWRGNVQTYDISFSNSHAFPEKHLLSYGGNFRHNEFDQSSMPRARGRNDGGAYFQDEFLLSKHLRWIFGARLDKFENLSGAMFSPRTTFIVKPVPNQSFRVSYNRAYVAPSTYGNFANLVFMTPLDLGLLNPQLAGVYFNFPGSLVGNRNLKERSMNAYELGYTASVAKGRANIGAAFYINDSKGQFYYPVTRSYTSIHPPPGWPLPLYTLDLLNAAGMVLPEVISFGNLGKVRNMGIELSADAQVNRYVSLTANYSWQARPDSREYDVKLYNLPPSQRVNAGMSLNYNRYFGSMSFSYVSSAYWNDMISLVYSGSTKGYRVANAVAGIRWGEKRQYSTSVKLNNLANARIQNHVFGDILKRQIMGEMKMHF